MNADLLLVCPGDGQFRLTRLKSGQSNEAICSWADLPGCLAGYEGSRDQVAARISVSGNDKDLCPPLDAVRSLLLSQGFRKVYVGYESKGRFNGPLLPELDEESRRLRRDSADIMVLFAGPGSMSLSVKEAGGEAKKLGSFGQLKQYLQGYTGQKAAVHVMLDPEWYASVSRYRQDRLLGQLKKIFLQAGFRGISHEAASGHVYFK